MPCGVISCNRSCATTGERQCRTARRQIDDAHVAPIDAFVQTCPKGLGTGLLGGKAFRERRPPGFLVSLRALSLELRKHSKTENGRPCRASVFSIRRMSIKSFPIPRIMTDLLRRYLTGDFIARLIHEGAHTPDR